MGDLYSIPSLRHRLEDRQGFGQQAMLERAVAKLVLFGEQVGVSAGQMIVLLESGLSVRELLDYLAARDKGTDSDSKFIS